MPDPGRTRTLAIRVGAAFAGAALLVAAGAVAVYWRSAAATKESAEEAGAPGPAADLYALTLADADGKQRALSQWRDSLLVVNFWATWCVPCVKEMPDLEALQQEYAGHGVTIIGIGAEDLAHVRQFRDHLGLHMTLLAGGYDSLALARAFGDDQGVLPYTAVLAPGGRVLHTQTGALLPGQLRRWIGEKS